MKEHPILFKPEMVRAILGGYKTQTRRLAERGVKYNVGDRLWVRETIGTIAYGRHYGVEVVYSADNIDFPAQRGVQFEHLKPVGNEKYRTMDLKKWPSIFMPRWASRITLEITEMHFEDLSSMTDEDALAEGVSFMREIPDADETLTNWELYQILWDSINLKPTPVKKSGVTVSYKSYPSDNKVFDSAYPGVRDFIYRGKYKGLPIDITANPEVAVITFKRIS